MRSRALAVSTAVVVVLLLSGCSGLQLLHHGASGGHPRSHAAEQYLTRLSGEQAKLAADERALPLHPRTPAALSRSIRALARAISSFAAGLAAVTPPPAVATLHRRLVAVASRYHDQLLLLAHRASRPQSEIAAANELAADTSAASTGFTATIVKIHARLVR